ncbi:unnamed protein product [marine sediment metagenome]|uniref:Uncharacterized protein n=1 Tax=marine sediment metagenome TaxID=412755 RepID=X1IAU7_9ZZZZ
MKKLTAFLALVMLFFSSGCGLVAVLGTSRSHEKKIPAEYDLTERTDQKILILVNQPAYLNAQANLRYHLTKAIRENLTAKIKIPHKYIPAYNELSQFRSNQPNFSLLSPAEVGEALGADMVLLVTIQDYQLNELAKTGYYKGFLGAQAALVETATGEKLWPKSAKSKSIKVGFEVESGGREVAVARLSTACAYCTTRYFYDCPREKFKIADDRSGIGWESWKK